ncbi:MAG: hypothetical protein QM811_24200 [Pirellulales bacterium]
MTRITRFALAALIGVGLFEASTLQAGCFGSTPQTTYYAPMAVAPIATPTVAQTTYMPVAQTSYMPVAQTTYMPAVPVAAPVATVPVAAAVPVTTYRPLFGGLFRRPTPVVAVAPVATTAGYVPYSAGYAPYTATYAPAAAYTAGYAPVSYTAGYAPSVAGYAPMTAAYPASTTSITTNYMPYVGYRATPIVAPSAVPLTSYYPSTPIATYATPVTAGYAPTALPVTSYLPSMTAAPAYASAPQETTTYLGSTYSTPAQAAYAPAVTPCNGALPPSGVGQATFVQPVPPAGAPIIGNGQTLGGTYNEGVYRGSQSAGASVPSNGTAPAAGAGTTVTPVPNESRKITIPDVPPAAQSDRRSGTPGRAHPAKPVRRSARAAN